MCFFSNENCPHWIEIMPDTISYNKTCLFESTCKYMSMLKKVGKHDKEITFL